MLFRSERNELGATSIGGEFFVASDDFAKAFDCSLRDFHFSKISLSRWLGLCVLSTIRSSRPHQAQEIIASLRQVEHRGGMERSQFTARVQARLREALQAVYGDRLARAVLFGSRARGEAHAESDYDVAVFLHGSEGLWAEKIGRAHV